MAGVAVHSSAETSLAAVQPNEGLDLSKDSLQDQTVDLSAVTDTASPEKFSASQAASQQQGLAAKKAGRGTNWGTISVGGYVKADVALLKLQNEMLQEGFPGATDRLT